ncbi:ublcp1 [Scenedesmus sp. PABB004]|nr:ublcp1 [Scenedesmus sp. PABB004]
MPQVVVKWSGKEYPVDLEEGARVEDLKRALQEQTHVDAKRQKLLGLKTRDGKPAPDGAAVSELSLKPGARVMMMGQPDDVIAQTAAAAAAAPEVQDDFDIGEGEEQSVQVKDQPEVLEKLQRRIKSTEVKILNPPRPGKKCLVLDIDYTLFDLNSSAERPDELARPFLHEFLAATYADYDIIIWSATNMKWVEVKMQELGVLGNSQYKLVCMLDHKAMVTVQTERYGVFDCKPLAFIWAKFPEHYNEGNTVMLDDLRRNFIMNRQNGLVIRPYKRAHLTRGSDRELLLLARYLTLVGGLDSLAGLDHRRWERYLAKHGG